MESAPIENEKTTPPPEAPPERPSTLLVVLVLVGIVAVSTIIAVSATQTDQSPNPGASVPAPDPSIRRGAACAELQSAADLLSVDDEEGFVAAVKRAARIGKDALQQSGVVFGRPERLALELASLMSNKQPSNARLERVMTAGIDACTSIDPG